MHENMLMLSLELHRARSHKHLPLTEHQNEQMFVHMCIQENWEISTLSTLLQVQAQGQKATNWQDNDEYRQRKTENRASRKPCPVQGARVFITNVGNHLRRKHGVTASQFHHSQAQVTDVVASSSETLVPPSPQHRLQTLIMPCAKPSNVNTQSAPDASSEDSDGEPDDQQEVLDDRTI